MEHRIDLVAFLHLKLIRGLITPEPTTVEQKRDGIEIHRLAVTVGVHQLLELCGPLDAEENLVAILQSKGGKVLEN